MNIKLMILFLVFGLWPLASYADEPSPVSQQLHGFNLNGYSNDGKKSWDVKGDKADISDDSIKITNVDANAYQKQKTNLTAKNGTIDKVTGDMHLQDDVVIKAERGTTMTTDSLDWSRNKDLVTTKDPVKIQDEQGTVTGIGLIAHPNLKKAQLNEDVKAVIQTASKTQADSGHGQTVTITSEGPMQMDQVKMYAVFNKNVVALEASTGRQLYADKMEMWFDDKNKKIKKAICTGHVKVIQGESASYADLMVYSGEDQTLTMTGRPKIVFNTEDTKGSGMFQPLGK